MCSKNYVLAGIAGGVTFFLLGWLVYGFLLMDFMASNSGTATGVQRAETELVWWALMAGNLCTGFLLSFVFSCVGSVKTATSGAKTGAWLGFLMAGSIDLSMYGTCNIMNLTGVLVDILAFTIMAGIAGAVVAWVLGKEK